MAINQNFRESTVSTTNHTQNYDLPLWTEGDKTSWLTQVNDAMNKIDSGMVDAKSKALEVVGIAADAKKLAEETSAESKESARIVAGYNDRLTAVETTSVEHTNDITALNTRCDQMDVEIHSVKETQKKTTEDLGTLADQVKHNKEDADATKQSVSVLNGNVVEVTGRVTTCEDDIDALQVTTATNTSNIAQAEENVATVSGRVTTLETEMGELSTATQSNTTAIGAINGNIDSIKTKDTTQDGQIAAINTDLSALDGRVSTLEDGASGTTKTVLMYAKSDTLSSVTDSNGTAQFSGCTLGAFLYSDGTCDFTLSSGDTNPFVTGASFNGSIGMFNLTDGVNEIMGKFRAKYPDIAIVRQVPQHAYPIVIYNTGVVPRYMANCTIFSLFTQTSSKMMMTTSYTLELSALSGGTVSVRYGFPDGEHEYSIGSKQNFLIASVIVSGV